MASAGICTEGQAVFPTGLTPADEDPERAKFEVWFVKTQTLNNYRRIGKEALTGIYIDGIARVAWRAWQEAKKQGRE